MIFWVLTISTTSLQPLSEEFPMQATPPTPNTATHMLHRGQVVEKIVRRSGFPLTRLAHKLGISRNTLYNRFNNPNLGYRFIMAVGNTVHYDFTVEFPNMKEELEQSLEGPIQTIDSQTVEILCAESKYIKLLEKYAKLLSILAKLANYNTLPTLKKEILAFIEQEEKIAPNPWLNA